MYTGKQYGILQDEEVGCVAIPVADQDLPSSQAVEFARLRKAQHKACIAMIRWMEEILIRTQENERLERMGLQYGDGLRARAHVARELRCGKRGIAGIHGAFGSGGLQWL